MKIAVSSHCKAFPEALLSHKRLAWVALGANPMAEDALEQAANWIA